MSSGDGGEEKLHLYITRGSRLKKESHISQSHLETKKCLLKMLVFV